MAGLVRQSLVSLSRKALNSFKITPSAGSCLQSLTTKTSTRGLTLKSLAAVQNKHFHCGCKYYSSTVDEELSKVLSKEIDLESKQAKKIKDLKGWKTETNGSDVTLTKTNGSEKITVKFSVNNSVFVPEEGFEEEAEESVAPAQVSKPPFDVDIEKSSGKKLRLVCEFTQEPSFMGQQVEDEEMEDDMFGIVEVHFIDGEEKDSDFFLTGESMDGEMYQVLMDMMDERGIDGDFTQDLMDFCTAYEHSQYISFLKTMQSFMQEK